MQVNAITELSGAFANLLVADVNESAWVKSFDVVYGTKNPDLHSYKEVTIEGDNIHFALRCRENEERASRDYNGGVPNYVVASMSFVVSDRPRMKGGSHGRRVITVPVKFNAQNTSHVTSVYTFDQQTVAPKKYKRSTAFLQDLLQDCSADKQARVTQYYNKGNNSFSDSYHHSERALWGALKMPAMIQSLVDGLLSQLPTSARNENPLADRVKVYSAVLDLHSTRYMCFECEPSSFIFQKKQGKFMGRLQDALNRYFTLSPKNGLTLFTRVSAEDNGKRSRKQLADHQNVWRDRKICHIRGKNISLVLQRDDRTTAQGQPNPYGTFVSSERMNAALPVFLAKRRDNASVALELTSSNRVFNTRVSENVQYVNDLLGKIKASQDPLQKLELSKQAYQMMPDDINILITSFNVLDDCKMHVESLDFIRKAQQYYLDHNDAMNPNYQIFRQLLAKIFKNIFISLGGNDEALIEKIGKLECLEELNERDCPLFYYLRGLHLLFTKDRQSAIRDFERVLKSVRPEDFQSMEDFTDTVANLKSLVKARA